MQDILLTWKEQRINELRLLLKQRNYTLDEHIGTDRYTISSPTAIILANVTEQKVEQFVLGLLAQE